MQYRAVAMPRKSQLLANHYLLMAVMVLGYLMLVHPALATATTPMGTVLCNVVLMIGGNLGRGLATLAIIIVGVGATLGKVSWGLAITVAVGISIIFNAPAIAAALGAGIGGCP